jgi:hypothetical protein
MPPIQQCVQKLWRGQRRKIVNSVYEFMKTEAERKTNEVTSPEFCTELQQIQKSVKEATRATWKVL